MDRGMLDLDDGQLRLPGHIQKDYPNEGSPDPVSIELDPEDDLHTERTLRSFISTRDDDTTALFPSRKSDRMTGKGINDVVKRLADRAEVRPHTFAARGDSGDVTAHTLRHSVAYRMLQPTTGTRSTTSGTGSGTRGWRRPSRSTTTSILCDMSENSILPPTDFESTGVA